jgi:hypothetical protein
MKGNEKFGEGVAKAFEKIIVSAVEPHMGEMADRFLNHLLGDDVSETSLLPRTKEYSVLWIIVKGTSEIQEAYESLLDVEVYIRRFPYKGTRVTKPRYLRSVIENYLNRVYVLKQRLKKFLQEIETLYAQGNRRKEVKKITQPLFTYLKNSLDNVVAIRGSSVHGENFNSKDLSQLDGLDFSVRTISGLSAQEAFQEFYDFQYGKIRLKWVKDIKDLNRMLNGLLDEYYSKLYQVIFDSNGELITPE